MSNLKPWRCAEQLARKCVGVMGRQARLIAIGGPGTPTADDVILMGEKLEIAFAAIATGDVELMCDAFNILSRAYPLPPGTFQG